MAHMPGIWIAGTFLSVHSGVRDGHGMTVLRDAP